MFCKINNMENFNSYYLKYNQMWNKSFNIRLFLTVFLLVFIPLYTFNYIYPGIAPFKFFANDSFYYFNLIKNSQQVNFFSYDGLNPTNGFHPIWEFTLFYLDKFNLIDINNKSDFLTNIYNINLFILSSASGFFAIFCSKYLKFKWLAVAVFGPGIMGLVLSITAPDYLATWSYVNGMETAIALLFFSLALFFYTYKNKSFVFLFLSVFFMGLLVLSRLDDIFFFIPFFLLLIFKSKGRQKLYIFLFFVPSAVLIITYLIYNRITVGIYMPISGWEKSGFALLSNISMGIKLFLPVFSWDVPNVLNTSSVNYSMYSEYSMRILQVLLPLFIAFIYLFGSYKKGKFNNFGILEALSFGIIIKALYNLLFVSLGRQGSWYFGTTIFITNFLLILWLSFLLDELLVKREKLFFLVKNWGVFIYILISIVLFNGFINHKLNGGFGDIAFNVFSRRENISDFIRKSGDNKFVEFEDGIIAFSTNIPAIGGLGPILDPEASLARKNGIFFDLLIKRGYTLIITSNEYSFSMDNYLKNKLWLKSEDLWGIKSAEFENYKIEKIHHDESGYVTYYKIVKLKQS